MSCVRWTLLILCACASSEPTVDPDHSTSWTGPPVAARVIGGGIDVVMTVPTLGHELALSDVRLRGETADAMLRWTAPGPDQIVGQQVCEVGVRVPAERLPESVRTVHVCIARWERGVHYVRAPDAVVAKVVPLR
jgi:hypothetical protein